MNPLIGGAFVKILQNKHTSAAGLVYVFAKWGCPLISTWFPHYKSQLDASADILESLAVFYGFAAAGDSAVSATKQEVAVVDQKVDATANAVKTGDTSILEKVNVPPVAPPPKTP